MESVPPSGTSLMLNLHQVGHVVCGRVHTRQNQLQELNTTNTNELRCFQSKMTVLTLVHDVLLKALWVMGNSLIQVLQKFTHTGYRDSKGLNKQQQLLRLQVLQSWVKYIVALKTCQQPLILFCVLYKTVPASTNRETSDRIILSFSQSGSRRASSDVSTKKAVGRGFLSGNQISKRL